MKKKILKAVDRSGLREMNATRQVQVVAVLVALVISAAVMGQRQANILAAVGGLSFNPELLCQMPGETRDSLRDELASKRSALAAAKGDLAANPYQRNARAQDEILAYTKEKLKPAYDKIKAADLEMANLEPAEDGQRYGALVTSRTRLAKLAVSLEAQLQDMELARQEIVYADGDWERYVWLRDVVAALPAEIDAINRRLGSFSAMEPCPTAENR